jgi:endoglucanase
LAPTLRENNRNANSFYPLHIKDSKEDQMKTSYRIASAVILAVLLFSACAGKRTPFTGSSFYKTRVPGLLIVQGNKITDKSGSVVVLAGLNICYPTVIQQAGHWNEDYFKELSSWGAGLVRVPIDPGTYRTLGAVGTFQMLDQAIAWAKKYGMYTIIDWHSVGNAVSGIFQPEYGDSMRTTPAEMKEFWAAAAARYANEPAAAFYEIFNEPSAMSYLGGSLTWEQWKAVVDDTIDVIYAKNPRAIPVAGGLEWAYDLTAIGASPLRNKGVVYAAHPYPGHASQPWETNWENSFGYLAKTCPVMLTEFGYDPDDTILPSVYKAGDDYGRRIIAYAKDRGMSWTAFVFCKCSGWPMPLFSEWGNYTPTASGAFFKGEMLK